MQDSTNVGLNNGEQWYLFLIGRKPQGKKKKGKGGKGAEEIEDEAPAQRRFKTVPSFFRTFARTSAAAVPRLAGGRPGCAAGA